MPDFAQSLMPSLQSIMDLARSTVNDMFPGIAGQNGRILSNDAAFTLPYLNEAFDTLQRKLRLEGVTFPDKVAILNNLVPLAQANPNISVYVGYNGYFDGLQMHATPMLPGDLLQPYWVKEQNVGSNVPFQPMGEPQGGVESVIQGPYLGVWDWRGYRIYMPGSLVAKNIQIRYKSGQPPIDVPASQFSVTKVNIMDSKTALAYMVASQYAVTRGAADITKLDAKAEDAISDMAQEYVRRSQGISYRRKPYGGSNSDDGGSMGQTGVNN